MSTKRTIPILALSALAAVALVAGFVARQAISADEMVAVASDRIVDSEPAEDNEYEATEAEAAGHNAAQAKAVNVPDFVPPKPATLLTAAEDVAFAMGDPSAPVHIVEFTDYQCPYCQRHGLETMPAIVKNLVDTGRVFYAIKDLPLDSIHPQARTAAVAARCAGEQDAYLAMHDAIFDSQSQWRGAGDEAMAAFASLASELGLDGAAFSSCITEGGHAEHVQANLDEAMALGVTGAPVFFVEGYGVSGAQPYELFEMVVELAERGELADAVEAQARQAYDAMVAATSPNAAARTVSRGEHDRDDGEHGEGNVRDEHGEESGKALALNESYDAVRNGARLTLAYNPESNAFNGTVQNTTRDTLKQVRVEVHLSNGKELGPTTPVDLGPGETATISLPATSQPFSGWTAHPEVGGGEHSN